VTQPAAVEQRACAGPLCRAGAIRRLEGGRCYCDKSLSPDVTITADDVMAVGETEGRGGALTPTDADLRSSGGRRRPRQALCVRPRNGRSEAPRARSDPSRRASYRRDGRGSQAAGEQARPKPAARQQRDAGGTRVRLECVLRVLCNSFFIFFFPKYKYLYDYKYDLISLSLISIHTCIYIWYD
jgi:hypothetical protein